MLPVFEGPLSASVLGATFLNGPSERARTLAVQRGATAGMMYFGRISNIHRYQLPLR